MQTEYERIGHALAAAGIEHSAAEVHGVLCGLLGGMKVEQARQRWREEYPLAGDEQDRAADDCSMLLDELAEETEAALDGEGLGFPLLLPTDEHPLRARGEAVRDWSLGFLYGFGLTEIPRRLLSNRAQEVLRDLSEFTRMDVDGIGLGGDEETEEEEESLMEITEFLWVAATLFREELAGRGVEEEAGEEEEGEE